MKFDNRYRWGFFLWIFAGLFASTNIHAAIITNINQFYSITPDQAKSGLPVLLKGVVNCYDSGWNQLYLFDGKNTYYLNPNLFTNKFEVGHNVQISGSTTLNGVEKVLTNLHVEIFGTQPLPQAKPLPINSVTNDIGQWIEIKGRVRLIDYSIGRQTLVLHDKGQTCLVYVLGIPEASSVAQFDPMGLLGCTVKIRGINATRTTNGKIDSAILFTPRTNEISIVEKSTIHLSDVPVISISNLLGQKPDAQKDRLVHINGLVTFIQPGVFIVVKDPTGTIQVQTIQKTEIQVDTRVNVYGYLTVSTNEAYITDAFFDTSSVLTPQSPTQGTSLTSRDESSSRVLTNAMDIMKLNLEDARKQILVHLKGVVTYADPEWKTGFFQDSSGGIFFNVSQNNVRSGQWVDLKGVTGPGGFAPEILQATLTILGTTNLPLPVKVELQDLSTGLLDAHWIEMEGVVRQIRWEWGRARLVLMTPKGRFKAVIPDPDNKLSQLNLIDAYVSIQGACSSEFNAFRQWRGVILNVPDFDHIRILDPAPKDISIIKSIPIQSVATFNPNLVAGRRIKISGQVTLRSPGLEFTIQDQTGGIRVYTTQPSDVQIGDLVNVIGFPSAGDFSPVLEEAILYKTGKGPLPTPVKATAEKLLHQGTNDSLLVVVEARLAQRIPLSSNPLLILQDGPILFTASIQNPIPGNEIPSMEPGSILKITGICSIRGGQQQSIKGLHLQLRQPDDVVLLKHASWWTTRNALMLVGGLMIAIVFTLTWIALLKRQVQNQTTLIHKKLKDELSLEQRYRELFENASDILLTLDMQGRCTSINHSGEKFFRLTRQEALGRQLIEGFSLKNPSLIKEQIKQLILRKDMDPFDAIVCIDNKESILDMQLRAIKEDNTIMAIQVTARDITEQKRTQEELLRTSHLAGMTEVATGVLHNVGNVLNSVNVSTTLLNERLKRSKIADLRVATAMLKDHSENLPAFLTEDPKGKRLPSYLYNVVEHISDEQSRMLSETESLTKNVSHIKDIVTMQQSYAKVMGVVEKVSPTVLLDDALAIFTEELLKHQIEVIRSFQNVPNVNVDKHKVLQILINLLSNAKHAIIEKTNNPEKKIVINIEPCCQDRVSITVEDTGIGIHPDNLTRIFGFGFTTRKNGHGFGLHLGAIAARELGGSLTATSDGIGKGACFTLELPAAQS